MEEKAKNRKRTRMWRKKISVRRKGGIKEELKPRRKSKWKKKEERQIRRLIRQEVKARKK